MTFRSVPVPRGQKRPADEGEGKQLRLHDVLDSFSFTGAAKRARLVPGCFPGSLNLGMRHNVRGRECIDIDSSDGETAKA